MSPTRSMSLMVRRLASEIRNPAEIRSEIRVSLRGGHRNLLTRSATELEYLRGWEGLSECMDAQDERSTLVHER